MVNNYFKVVAGSKNYLFPFDDMDVHLMTLSFGFAKSWAAECGGVLTTFRAPLLAGPWDEFALVGHRSRAAIIEDLADLKEGTFDGDEEGAGRRLSAELDALDDEYAYRVPTKEVA